MFFSIPRSNSLALAAVFVSTLSFVAANSSRADDPTQTPKDLAAKRTAFDGDGMWIWIAAKSHGGSAAAIAKRAKKSGIETIYLKSGDAGNYWNQFNPGFVNALKQQGLKVCAWQYVYGKRPTAEADVAARAVKNGADCFVIDAEAEYEGKYASARTYVKRLRAQVGKDYPIGLAAFPYVNFHPSFPYSVFMGPGGAQFNLPQMYWRAIGVSVNAVFATTYMYNLPYGKPIRPLGQTYMNPGGTELNRFRALGQANGSSGVSWWDWQSSKSRHWNALAKPLPGDSRATVYKNYPLLKSGSKGDLVIWAQGHLRAAGFEVPVSGYYRSSTAKAVAAFRNARDLGDAPTIDTPTWKALLKEKPTAASFLRKGRASAASAWKQEPESAKLPARAYEIPPKSR